MFYQIFDMHKVLIRFTLKTTAQDPDEDYENLIVRKELFPAKFCKSSCIENKLGSMQLCTKRKSHKFVRKKKKRHRVLNRKSIKAGRLSAKRKG
jgi:hypothetical protein